MRITPLPLINGRSPALLAADVETLANADANKIHLIKVPFTPATYTVHAEDVATFTGSAAKSPTIGEQSVFVDPLTGNRVVQLKEPIGGWNWICTAAPAEPETIYGICFTDDGGVTYGSALLEDGPVTIAQVGDGLTIGEIQFLFRPGYLG